MPDSTAYLQTLDTHFFSSLKQNILKAKAAVHLQEESAYRQLGVPYIPQWGAPQLASVLAQAWSREQARLDDHDWIVSCGIQNQLWVWRPDAEGNTISVDQDPLLQDHRRLPPPAKASCPNGPRTGFWRPLSRMARRQSLQTSRLCKGSSSTTRSWTRSQVRMKPSWTCVWKRSS